jgi:hypothetical protein
MAGLVVFRLREQQARAVSRAPREVWSGWRSPNGET